MRELEEALGTEIVVVDENGADLVASVLDENMEGLKNEISVFTI